MGEARPRPRVGRRSEHAGRPARLGAPRLRLPLLLPDDRARRGAARTRGRPERVLRERVREDVGALRRRGAPIRPGADPSAAGSGREPERRRVALPRDRGGEPGVRADPARARRAGDRTERARPRAGRRAAGARPAAARARRRPEREHPHVAHAVRRGCGPETIELLVSHGADVNRPGGETWRGDVPLRTPYQHAVLRGKDELAAAARAARRLDRGRPGGRGGRLDRARRVAARRRSRRPSTPTRRR